MTSGEWMGRWSLAVACAVGAAPAVAAPTSCRPDEQTLFACSVGKKLLAVCASRGLTPASGYLQYRFGSRTAAELVLPTADTAPAASATSGVLSFSGGGGATLRFSNGPVDYVVYTAISGSWGEASGVVVERGDKVVGSLKCRGKVVSELGPDLFGRLGVHQDEHSFELPE